MIKGQFHEECSNAVPVASRGSPELRFSEWALAPTLPLHEQLKRRTKWWPTVICFGAIFISICWYIDSRETTNIGRLFYISSLWFAPVATLNATTNRHKPYSESRLLDDLTEYHARVRVAYSIEGGLLYGEDLGIVHFEEGWMIFEGERTRFSLRTCDTFGGVIQEKKTYFNARLIAPSPVGRVFVDLTDLRAKDNPSVLPIAGMLGVFWNAGAVPRGFPILPPITPPQEAELDLSKRLRKLKIWTVGATGILAVDALVCLPGRTWQVSLVSFEVFRFGILVLMVTIPLLVRLVPHMRLLEELREGRRASPAPSTIWNTDLNKLLFGRHSKQQTSAHRRR